MKTCPTCQKEFPDSMRFCQTDGTPLVDAAPAGEQPDPFKTVVGGSANPTSSANDPFKTVVGGMPPKEEDLLQLPQDYDPMKTMVSSDIKRDIPSSSSPFDAPKQDSSPFQNSEPEKPKFGEPSLSPPSFGDLSGSSSDKPSDSPFSNNPPSFGSSPLPSESSSSGSPFDKPVSDPLPSVFDKSPPPPYKSEAPGFGSQPQSHEPEQKFPGAHSSVPFDTPSPSFAEPQTPFGQQSNDPFGQPFQQNEWAPPPAPVQGWQDQGLGANTPFTPPVAGAGGQNQTLAIIALVCGILGLCCGPLSIVAIITGFMGKKNADQNPNEYGGRGMALAGIILGGIGIVFMIIGIILNFLPFLFR